MRSPFARLTAVRSYFETRGYRAGRRRDLSAIFPSSDVDAAVREIERDDAFLNILRERLSKHSDYRPSRWDFGYVRPGGSVFFPGVTQYVVVRLLQPEIVVETGGTPGKSSAFMLRAMERNRKGRLITLDLEPTVVESEMTSSMQHVRIPAGLKAGWIVPENLRERQRLVLGKSRDTLPRVLADIESLDLFIHDGGHSYGNMTFEFEAAYPKLRPGGLLLSDDIVEHTAWQDFVAKHPGDPNCVIANFGVLVKKA